MLKHKFEEMVVNAPEDEQGNAAIALAVDYTKQILEFVGGTPYPELPIIAAVFGHLEYIFKTTTKKSAKMMGQTADEIEEDKKAIDGIKTILNSISTADIMAIDENAIKRGTRDEDEQE